ncbi:MAG TPA: acyl-CoA dehydrogenase family protein [Solirubrobacteraceae bacterium]|nr:acyl-CoA dehydrogenase family protein [Solirubrobacteraceae bacterium]
MGVQRLLSSDEATAVVEMASDFARRELAPRAAQAEAEHRFPREVFTQMGELGLLAMPYPEEYGGFNLPYEVYLQALEEVGAAWSSVAVGLSVHVMSCYALHTFGTPEQKERWLGDMLSGRLLGGYCLSEADAGSDPAAMRARAVRSDDGAVYRVSGQKAWVTNGGEADFYTLFARTGEGPGGISCFLSPGQAPGLEPQALERKMGMTASPTRTLAYDDVALEADRLIGREGDGLSIALSALDSGRLGIAACAVGLAQAALGAAVAYAKERQTFGRAIIDHQGLGFLLADMAAGVESSRAVMLEAARRRDAGLPYSRQASIAKLVCTDTAMKVTTDAVQVFGGAGYTEDFPVERMMREAKIMQIFEGTNQIQRMVIARHLARA